MPPACWTRRHEYQRSATERCEVVLLVHTPNVLGEFYTPGGIKQLFGPVCTAREVVLHNQLERQQRVRDCIVRALDTQNPCTAISEIRGAEAHPTPNIDHALDPNVTEDKVPLLKWCEMG
eukprot:CAMPEP_0119465956 /NCGR_PEP_ID=MMETSP1344-20130328/840_1 /TAXON_ID=236787 /ORGANISM="Florenciella parvula, Strain CCMP2471" /LENGTH=119 /DNA_ID=CAMNT_0007498243 /DNA_START=733 /DNA_END=1092 /DNA_ORIENTATION=-